jgi:deoxyribodipyrimidine photolyase-related protein
MHIFIVFPNQLFENITPLKEADFVYIIEEHLFFNQYHFHKQKLVLHRASMQFYLQYLLQQKIKTTYINATQKESNIINFIEKLKAENITKISCYNVVDNWLGKFIRSACQKNNVELNIVESPLYLNTHKQILNYFLKKSKYIHNDFYIQQRKENDILITNENKPVGDKWSFDTENRMKYPKNKLAPKVTTLEKSEIYKAAEVYVEKNYKLNIGNYSNDIIYPTTFTEARLWLQEFLKTRFNEFGIYEDAIVDTELILNHSVLTPFLNIGLITPKEIVTEILKYSVENNILIQNTEGFIRQIIGWREFIRGIYVLHGSKQRTTNFWKFKRKIPSSFYTGTTGILPVDDTIKKILNTGYCHHIERLMILGNFMLLCEFEPDEVYKWFMELFIDAYDWVMVPNIYGMSQFADGGIMATKPYISGSNYIIKMSNYKKTNMPNGWDAIWDGLFWRFMHVHRSFFLGNPRLGMLIHSFDKMPEIKQNNHLELANLFLKKFDV